MVEKILLWKNKRIHSHAIVDDIDYDYLNQWKWYVGSNGYAMRTSTLHQEVVGVYDTSKYVIDHINGDKLDARTLNLRIVTATENQYNRKRRSERKYTSDNMNVRLHYGKWFAVVTFDWKQYNLGTFDSEQDASKAVSIFKDRLTGKSNENLNSKLPWEKGVSKENSRWRARPTISGKKHHIGVFDTEADAEEAIVRTRLKINPEIKKDIRFQFSKYSYLSNFQPPKINAAQIKDIDTKYYNLPIYKNEKIISYAKVDDDLKNKLNPWTWRLSVNGYPCRTVMMHREIAASMGLFSSNVDGTVIDHIDSNRLNAIRSNLQKLSQSENIKKRRQTWLAN